MYIHYVSSTDYTTVTGWSTAADVAFVRTGIEYDAATGRFTINRQGLYAVYSHMSFRRSSGASDGEGFIYSQKIVREKHYEESTVREDLVIDTEVEMCSEDYPAVPCYSSKVLSQLRLRRGDELFVETLNPELLIADGTASYFGLYLIG